MWKVLQKCFREIGGAVFLVIVLAIGEVAWQIAIPWYMTNLIDLGLSAQNLSVVYHQAGILIFLVFLELSCGIGVAWLNAYVTSRFAFLLREQLYQQVTQFSFANLYKFSTASLINRLTGDVTNLANALQALIRLGVQGPALLLLAMIASFNLSREISLMFLAIIPIIALFSGLIIKTVLPLFKKVFVKYDELDAKVQENIKGIRVVKSFNQQQQEIGNFKKISQEIYRYYAQGERVLALNTPLMQLCIYACMLLISFFGAKAIVASGNQAAVGMSTGALSAMITYAMQILQSLMLLSMVFVVITISRAAFKRVSEVLLTQPSLTAPENGLTCLPHNGIEFSQVDFYYQHQTGKKVLSQISFCLNPGQTVGIVGATGSGKTSLVQLIARLYDPSSGEILLGGQKINTYKLPTLRSQIAMVLQKDQLFAGSVLDNLRWGNPQASESEIKHLCRLLAADEFISTMPAGYRSKIEQAGANLSGGQKQRLYLVRALLKKPAILILDDAMSALDNKTLSLVQKGLVQCLPKATKIIITQRPSCLRQADVILVLENGKLVAVGTHQHLLKESKIYRDMEKSEHANA